MQRMSSTRWTIAFIACLAAATASACINETGTTRSGNQAYVDITPQLLAHALVTPKQRRREEIRWAREVIEEARVTPRYEDLNELAVVLMRFGKPREAVALLEYVEKRFPGRLPTPPNLGTAYELAGDNVHALQWIREGMKRNPNDHAGTEWLHAAILEAKIARRTRALELDFGPGPLPRRPPVLPAGNDGKPVTVKELGLALQLQLQERAYFVPAPDALVAGLIFDLAQLQLVDGTMENAKVLYAAADRYGYPDKAAIQRGLAEAGRVIASGKSKGDDTVECPLCMNPDPDRPDAH
jgi:hypothetical protein